MSQEDINRVVPDEVIPEKVKLDEFMAHRAHEQREDKSKGKNFEGESTVLSPAPWILSPKTPRLLPCILVFLNFEGESTVLGVCAQNVVSDRRMSYQIPGQVGLKSACVCSNGFLHQSELLLLPLPPYISDTTLKAQLDDVGRCPDHELCLQPLNSVTRH
jgi:hypothetical protein